MKDGGSYQDRGCVFCPRCSDCPFPDCLKDTYRSVLSELRKREAKELTRQGKSVIEIAKILGVSRMQAHRYVTS